jgi:hypothetical protein
MQDKLLDVAQQVAIRGSKEVIGFFDSDGDEVAKKAQMGISALRAAASVRSTRAREASTALSIAKYSNIDGAELRPMFDSLTKQG